MSERPREATASRGRFLSAIRVAFRHAFREPRTGSGYSVRQSYQVRQCLHPTHTPLSSRPAPTPRTPPPPAQSPPRTAERSPAPAASASDLPSTATVPPLPPPVIFAPNSPARRSGARAPAPPADRSPRCPARTRRSWRATAHINAPISSADVVRVRPQRAEQLGEARHAGVLVHRMRRRLPHRRTRAPARTRVTVSVIPPYRARNSAPVMRSGSCAAKRDSNSAGVMFAR